MNYSEAKRNAEARRAGLVSVTDRREETQFLDRQTSRVPSTFGKALNVKDYGTRLWSRTSRNDTSIDFAKNIKLTRRQRYLNIRCDAIDLPQVWVVNQNTD